MGKVTINGNLSGRRVLSDVLTISLPIRARAREDMEMIDDYYFCPLTTNTRARAREDKCYGKDKR